MKKFTKNPNNPIFGDSSTGTVFDVYVSRSEEMYRMDFSWRPKKAVAVAFSENLKNWTKPVITLGADCESGWEDQINRNCVIFDGNRYLMWCTGQARGYSFIGVAESRDGTSFTKLTDDPVTIPERNHEGASVMNPCVIYDNGKYRMWYTAGETYEPNVICLAESEDGIHWQKDKINPIFTADKSKEYEKDRIGGCHVIKTNNLGYLMFYIGYKDVNTACICAAISQNGRTGWKRCRFNPLVSPTENSFDADSCYKPSAVYCDGGWHVFYNGRRNRDEYIGEAFLEGDFSLDNFE